MQPDLQAMAAGDRRAIELVVLECKAKLLRIDAGRAKFSLWRAVLLAKAEMLELKRRELEAPSAGRLIRVRVRNSATPRIGGAE